MVFWFPVVMWIAALVAAGFTIGRMPAPRRLHQMAQKLLGCVNLFPVGIMGLWAALGHTVFAEESARAIGWAPSPFQFEVAMANLGIGVAGVISAFTSSWGFRAGLAVVVTFFLGGAAVGHLVQIAHTGDMAAGNAGPILYTDMLTPLALIVLLALTCRGRKPACVSSGSA